MELRMRSRPIFAALISILAGLTVAASAIATSGDSLTTMPSGTCPPQC